MIDDAMLDEVRKLVVARLRANPQCVQVMHNVADEQLHRVAREAAKLEMEAIDLIALKHFESIVYIRSIPSKRRTELVGKDDVVLASVEVVIGHDKIEIVTREY